MAEKINLQEIKALIAQVQKLDRQTKTVVDGAARHTALAKQQVQAIRARKVREALAKKEVEALNFKRAGIRVATLRSCGYTTVLSVLEAPLKALIDIDGISEEGARQIKEVAAEIERRTSESTGIRLSPDAQGAEENKLVQELYVLLHTEKESARAEKIRQAAHKPLMSNLEAAKPVLNRWRWFFASRKVKEAASAALGNLRKWVGGGSAQEIPALEESYRKTVSGAYVTVCWEDFVRNSARYYVLLEKLDQGHKAIVVGKYGLDADLVSDIEAVQPDLTGMKTELRFYQRFGVQYILKQGNVLLGDEMGLGKTVQAIATMVSLRNAGATHFMVVCPASVLINWCHEISRHCDLTPIKIHGHDEKALALWEKEGGVAVTTFETTNNFTPAEGASIALLVVDEAHYVKNPKALRTVNVGKLRECAQRILYMTGTPLVRDVADMCFLVRCLKPELAEGLEEYAVAAEADEFRRRLATVYLRRAREDVLKELPDLIESEEWCAMNGTELQAYRQAVLEQHFMKMRRVSWSSPELQTASKAVQLLEICTRAKEEGRKVLVFSYFTDTIAAVRTLLGECCIGPIDGSTSTEDRQQLVHDFEAAPEGAVLVAQIVAGGVGLNIQAASVVVICEPQLTPAIEKQAIGRAYRMGQVRNVLVYRLLCEESIDERIMEILKQRQQQYHDFADQAVTRDEFKKLAEEEMQKMVLADPLPQ